MTGCDLRGANLRGANLAGVNFDGIISPLHMSQTVNVNVQQSHPASPSSPPADQLNDWSLSSLYSYPLKLHFPLQLSVCKLLSLLFVKKNLFYLCSDYGTILFCAFHRYILYSFTHFEYVDLPICTNDFSTFCNSVMMAQWSPLVVPAEKGCFEKYIWEW